MPLGPEDITLTGKTLTGGTISGSTLTGVNIVDACTIAGIRVTTSTVVPNTNDQVTLGTSSLRFSAVYVSSGVGFPAAVDASADANVLDDYEEGTFTPTWTPATTGTFTIGYNAATTGNYTKIGDTVRVNGFVQVTTHTSGTGTGQMGISALPFACRASGAGHLNISSATSGYRGFDTALLSTATAIARAVLKVATTGASSALNLADLTTGANTFHFSGVYGI